MSINELLTTKQVAGELRKHINTVRKYLNSGVLKGHKWGGNGKSRHHWRIKREDFERFKLEGKS